MFNIFRRDPNKKLRKQYDTRLEQAMQAQRRGDIKSFAMLTDEAEKLWQQLQEQQQKGE
ncbi:DUF6435 family protein [Lacimicrobium alkaliphilum]|uniref:Lacal_2735 family protein n=1 Tax=Lacimicrobium alkaliphilum TaxID=1526571 RepID=A0ABQ1RIE0_9ALTE|nr:DUF6435 family protein [Lacimicrobium alkaliphilum]GGD69325.1 hypothetical protein GCM10011357_25500 [Lacimicrobium alkaliphilum]